MAEGGFDRLDRNGPVPQGTFGGIPQLRTCPYVPSHWVGAGSFALHLVKCRNAAPEHIRKQFVVCEYNPTHHMLESLYMDHLKICDDYREVKASRFQLPAELKNVKKNDNHRRIIKIKEHKKKKIKLQNRNGSPSRPPIIIRFFFKRPYKNLTNFNYRTEKKFKRAKVPGGRNKKTTGFDPRAELVFKSAGCIPRVEDDDNLNYCPYNKDHETTDEMLRKMYKSDLDRKMKYTRRKKPLPIDLDKMYDQLLETQRLSSKIRKTKSLPPPKKIEKFPQTLRKPDGTIVIKTGNGTMVFPNATICLTRMSDHNIQEVVKPSARVNFNDAFHQNLSDVCMANIRRMEAEEEQEEREHLLRLAAEKSQREKLENPPALIHNQSSSKKKPSLNLGHKINPNKIKFTALSLEKTVNETQKEEINPTKSNVTSDVCMSNIRRLEAEKKREEREHLLRIAAEKSESKLLENPPAAINNQSSSKKKPSLNLGHKIIPNKMKFIGLSLKKNVNETQKEEINRTKSNVTSDVCMSNIKRLEAEKKREERGHLLRIASEKSESKLLENPPALINNQSSSKKKPSLNLGHKIIPNKMKFIGLSLKKNVNKTKAVNETKSVNETKEEEEINRLQPTTSNFTSDVCMTKAEEERKEMDNLLRLAAEKNRRELLENPPTTSNFTSDVCMTKAEEERKEREHLLRIAAEKNRRELLGNPPAVIKNQSPSKKEPDRNIINSILNPNKMKFAGLNLKKTLNETKAINIRVDQTDSLLVKPPIPTEYIYENEDADILDLFAPEDDLF